MAPQRPIGRRRKPQKIISFRALHQKNRFLVKALGQVAAETPGGADHGLRRGVPSPAAARHTTCPSHYGPKEQPPVAAASRGEILGAECWSDGGWPIDNCVRPTTASDPGNRFDTHGISRHIQDDGDFPPPTTHSTRDGRRIGSTGRSGSSTGAGKLWRVRRTHIGICIGST